MEIGLLYYWGAVGEKSIESWSLNTGPFTSSAYLIQNFTSGTSLFLFLSYSLE